MHARVKDGVAIELFDVPQGLALKDCFHPSLLAEFVTVPNNTKVGSTLVNGSWVAPVIPTLEKAKPRRPVLTPTQFKLLWTVPELIAIDELRQIDKTLDKVMDLLEDPKTEEVDLNLRSVKDTITYTVTALPESVLVASAKEQRIKDILTGVFD